MNAKVVLGSLASILSFASAGGVLLPPALGGGILSGGSVGASACALASGVLCLFFVWAERRSASNRPIASRGGPAAHLGSLGESAPDEQVPSLAAALERLRAELGSGPDALRAALDHPTIRSILAARTRTELEAGFGEAHRTLESARATLALLSTGLVTDCKAVLPLANAILKAVPDETEQAAFAVMDKFMVVREASSRAAGIARKIRADIDDVANPHSVKLASENSRRTVRAQRDAVKELSTCLRENREQLGDLGREIAKGLELLKSITEITERAKLIAFNMSIEAARIGEKGRGFKVIIVELHRLNEQTFDFSRRVAELLGRFRDYNARLVANVEDKAGAVIVEVGKGMDAAETAVESLIEASSRAQDFSGEIAVITESIDHDLDGVLEALQFQDITRQMIEGAQTVLGTIANSLDSCLGSDSLSLDEIAARRRFESLKSRFIADSKTKGEKNALMEVEL